MFAWVWQEEDEMNLLTLVVGNLIHAPLQVNLSKFPYTHSWELAPCQL